MLIDDYIIILFFGLIGGFISGLLGVGGGLLFIPALEFYLKKMGVNDIDMVKFILANSLFVIIFSGIIITYKQIKINNFYIKQVIQTTWLGLISTVIMTYAIEDGWFLYDKKMFTLVFLSMLAPLVFRMVFDKQKDEIENSNFPSGSKMGIAGFFTGIITSMSGLGGGIVMVPVFTNLLKINIKKATSISTGVIPILAIANGLLYIFATHIQQVHNLQTGYVVYPLVLPLILGVLITAPMGVQAAKTMKPFPLKIIFASVISIIMIVKVLQLNDIL